MELLPKDKYWKVTKHEIGRELGNPDYIKYLESRLKQIEELTKPWMAYIGIFKHYSVPTEDIEKIYKLAKDELLISKKETTCPKCHKDDIVYQCTNCGNIFNKD